MSFDPEVLKPLREEIEKQKAEYPKDGTPEQKYAADRALEEAYKAFVRAGGSLFF